MGKSDNAEYAGCTCGRCGRAKRVEFPWPEDAEKLDEYASGLFAVAIAIALEVRK